MNLHTIVNNTGLVSLPMDVLVFTEEGTMGYSEMKDMLKYHERWTIEFNAYLNDYDTQIPFMMKLNADNNITVGPVDNTYTYNDCIENKLVISESWEYDGNVPEVEYDPTEPEEEEEEEEEPEEPEPSNPGEGEGQGQGEGEGEGEGQGQGEGEGQQQQQQDPEPEDPEPENPGTDWDSFLL